MTKYTVSRRRIMHASDIEADWLDLQARSDCSFFQSWGWIGGWLKHVVADLDPLLLAVSDGDHIVAMGVFIERSIHRHGVIRSAAVFLNEYPFAERDMAVEYNGLLIDRACGDVADIYRTMLTYFDRAPGRYDEFFFGGIRAQPDKHALQKCQDAELRFRVEEKSCSWQVDLNGFSVGLDAYLSTLSKNRRAQIRRSMRMYGETGELCLSQAETPEQALEYFSGLERLHSDRWRRKGLPGSFVNPVWVQFHKELIKSRFKYGEIQLLEVMAGRKVIGYLYNFVWRRRVYVLQTGFAISGDKRLMPGYVVHTMAITYNHERGHDIYDFLHGDSVYKRVLSSRSEPLYWIVLQKRHWKFDLENSLRLMYRRLKGRRPGAIECDL